MSQGNVGQPGNQVRTVPLFFQWMFLNLRWRRRKDHKELLEDKVLVQRGRNGTLDRTHIKL